MGLSTIIRNVIIIFLTCAVMWMTDFCVTATSDIDVIRQMFPGRYDNDLQHEHEKALHVPEPELHPLLHVNVSVWGPVLAQNVSYFLFQARNPELKSVTLERIFSVTTTFNSSRLLFTVHHKTLEQPGEATRTSALNGENRCSMLWQKTVYGSYRNINTKVCSVDGVDDKYMVNTTMELSESYFNILELWTALPREFVIPGPPTAFHFIKQQSDNSPHR